MYKVLVQSNAADEFFRLLLSPENRTFFRNQFQESEIVQVYGCSIFNRNSRITKNNKVLTIYSSLLPSGVKIEYHKNDSDFIGFDKLIIWEVFPAEDNEQLEKKINFAEKTKKNNIFFQIDIILYNGNVRTASTDLKNNIESLEESRNNCENKYTQCNVHALKSEEDFIQNILYLLIPKTCYRKKEIAYQIDLFLSQKEKDLQTIYYLYDFEMEFLSNQNGVLSSEQLYSICDWKNVAYKYNIMEAYFDAFFESNTYKSITDEIVEYYNKFIKDIRIWDEKEDCNNLIERIKKGLLHKKEILSKNAVSAPETKIKYKSPIYTDKILEFNKAISDFFSDDAKEILCLHISEKIKIYGGLLK